MAILTGLGTMGISWMNTKAPVFGRLIAVKDYTTLDRVFFHSLSRSLLLICTAAAMAWAVVCYLNHINSQWANRLLAPLPFGILALATIINHIVFSEAIYLRAHKKEPFLWASVALGASNAILAYFLGRKYGAFGVICSYSSLSLIIGLCAGTWVFVTKRRQWHSI